MAVKRFWGGWVDFQWNSSAIWHALFVTSHMHVWIDVGFKSMSRTQRAWTWRELDFGRHACYADQNGTLQFQ